MKSVHEKKDQCNTFSMFSPENKLEVESIIPFCTEYAEKYSCECNLNISWEKSFLMMLLGEYSTESNLYETFWSPLLKLSPLNPIWRINLSTEAFKFISDQKCKIKIFQYLIDLIKGRFKIKEKFDKYYLIRNEQYSKNLKLFAIIVELKHFKPGFKILVGKAENSDHSKQIDEIIKEICENSNMLENLNTFTECKILYNKNNVYIPGRSFFKQNKTLHSKLTKDLAKLKQYIKNNRLIYLNSQGLFENDLISWTELVLHCLLNQTFLCHHFNIFSEFSIVWKLSIEKEILISFKSMKKEEFLLYLNKILRFCQGFVIDDIEEFFKINETPNHDFLIVPLNLNKKNLKPIFSVLCVEYCYLSEQHEYFLKLIEYYHKNSINQTIESFRIRGNYSKIVETFAKPNLNSMILIEKNISAVPALSLKHLEISNVKKIYFLQFLPQDSNNITFKISPEIIKANISNRFVDIQEDEEILHLICIETEVDFKTEYIISKFIKRSWHLSDKKLNDKERSIQNIKIQFLFDIDFEFKNDKSNKNPILNYLKQFYQYLYFLSKFWDNESLEFLIYSFCNLKIENKNLNNSSLELKKLIVELVKSFYIGTFTENEVERLYQVLSLLGILWDFLSFEEFSNLGNFLDFLQLFKTNSKAFFYKYKARLNYEIAMKGLTYVFVVARSRCRDKDMKSYFEAVVDYNILPNILCIYLGALKEFHSIISPIEQENIIQFTNSFHSSQKSQIIKKLLELGLPLIKKLTLLITQFCDQISINEKKNILMEILNTDVKSNEELLITLKFFKKEQIYSKNLINIDYACKIIMKILNPLTEIELKHLGAIEEILTIIKREKFFNNLDLRDFLLSLIKTHGFENCEKLIKIFPQDNPFIFFSNFFNNQLNVKEKKWIQIINENLSFFEIQIQESILLYFFDKFSEQDLKDAIEIIDNFEYSTVKSAYKTVFTRRLLNYKSYIFDNTVDFINLKKKENEHSQVIKDLFKEIQYRYTTTKNDLINKILKYPKEGDSLLNLINDYDRKNGFKNIETILEFIKEHTANIENKNLKVATFKIVIKQGSKDRNAFMKYLYAYYKNHESFMKFSNNFKQIENEFKDKLKKLKLIKRVIYIFSFVFPQLKQLIKDFEKFVASMAYINLNDFNIPDSLSIIMPLLEYPIKSTMFINCVFSKVPYFNQGFEKCFNLADQMLSEFLLKMTNFKGNSVKIGEIKRFVQGLNSPANFKKEIKALSIAFPDIFKKNLQMHEEMEKLISFFYEYKDWKVLFSSLDTSCKNLELSRKLYESYFLDDSEFYDNKFPNLIVQLNELKLMSQDQKTLITFFDLMNKSHELLNLAYSLEYSDLSYWLEIPENYLSKNNISLDQIDVFRYIWGFLNKIKNANQNISSYFEKILELIKTNGFTRIMELIIEKNSIVNNFIEFNNSILDKNQVKLNVVRKIYYKSKLTIFKHGEGYIVDAVPEEIGELKSSTLNSSNHTNKESDHYSLKDLIEHKDFALLTKNIINENQLELKHQTDLKTYEKFIDFVNTVQKFISILNKLEKSLCRNFVPKLKEYTFEGGISKSLDRDFVEYNYQLAENWLKAYKTIRNKSFLINFLSWEMIYLVEEYINEKSQDKNKIMRVFKYLCKIPQSELIKTACPSLINERLIRIDNFLVDLTNTKQIPIPWYIPIKNLSKFSILISENNNLCKEILSIYANYRKIIPQAEYILFCHFSTNWPELKRFLMRSCMNNNEIYTLVNPEKLSLRNQIKLDKKINLFIRNDKNFHLAFVTLDSKSKLINSLNYNPLLQIEKIEKSMSLTDMKVKEILRITSSNFLVVTSKIPGLGKTEFIKEEARIRNLPLIEINISATYDNESLFSKIESLIQQSKAAYKFNLLFLSDPEYFCELIFSLAVCGLAYNKHSFICIPDGSFIYIEVANSTMDSLYKSVQFLKYLEKKHIEYFSLDKLKITNDVIYVLNYLYLTDNKQIDKTDLLYNDKLKLLFKQPNLCHDLLNKYFIDHYKNYINFHHLTTFIKVFSKILRHFEMSPFSTCVIRSLAVYSNQYSMDIFLELRSKIMICLIETCKEYISRTNGESKLLKWEESNHHILIFLIDGSFMNIYRHHTMIQPEFKSLLISQNLLMENAKNKNKNSSKKLWDDCKKGIGPIDDYSVLSSQELIIKLISFYREYSYKRLNITKQNCETLDAFGKRLNKEALNTGYVLTPDNFLKMNLIFVRCISNLPLIIMGETGCGKTSLLRFFIENILGEIFLIIYIHSGITVLDIRAHLEKANEKANEFPNQNVWVFFDEFNTSDCMGDIISVLCERQFDNMSFKDNLVFVGACNPYRVKNKEGINDNVGIKRFAENKKLEQLIHMVRDLPEKAKEFVWDFGTLKHNEIRVYVKSMLTRPIAKKRKVGQNSNNFKRVPIYNKLDHAEIERINLFTDLICTAHEFFQDKEDCSSVSLRDVNRFLILHRWFEKSLSAREKFPIKETSEAYSNLKKKIQNFDEIKNLLPRLFAFIHCYYLRLSIEKDRKSFLDVIEHDLKKFELTSNLISDLIKIEQLDLTIRMQLPSETAKNQALVENIFAIIPCILTKTPIFICGKPGCSKSLAISIIMSSFKGDFSYDGYLKTLPGLQFFSFQGSDSCTSEGIEEIFSRAEKFLSKNNKKKTNKGKKYLPIVLFDEIGLAELSKSNPLKVLHRLLEYENCKVGFIGISNWRLDASKMNRGLFLARTEPDEKDLILTTQAFFNSRGSKFYLNQCMTYLEDVAKGYYEMKDAYSKGKFPDFIGLRDFYHTIKYIAKNLDLDNMDKIVQEALCRNFDGLRNSFSELEIYFSALFRKKKKEKNSLEMIASNLVDPESRYLMIICRADISEFIKSGILSEKLKYYEFILGSTFKNDKNEEDSKFRNLSNIISYMETGTPLILQNMDIIYSSLYDLFNQNFTCYGSNKKYCRIALGAQLNPKCLVHNNFKAIVFLDSQESSIESADAPFLNRFEKHFIDINDIIQKTSLRIFEEIDKWVNATLTIPNKVNMLQAHHVFPVYNQDSMKLFIEFTKSNVEKCKEFLLENATQDIILLCRVNQLNSQEKQEIEKIWKSQHCISFKNYLKILADDSNKERVKMISITYDSIDIELIKMDLPNEKIQFEKCSNFKNELDFNTNYKMFLNKENKSLYILEFYYNKESLHLRFIINLIDILDNRFKNKVEKAKKNICIILRQTRSDEHREPLLLFKDWKYRMFEDFVLNSKEIVEDIERKSLTTIIKEEKYFKFENFYTKIVNRSFETFKPIFDDKGENDYGYVKNFLKQVSEIIYQDTKLMKIIYDKIFEEMKKNEINKKEKWLESIFTCENITHSAISIKYALKMFIYDYFFCRTNDLIVYCQNIHGLNSLLSRNDSNLHTIWLQIFSRIVIKKKIGQIKPESNNCKLVGQFDIPFFYEGYKNLVNKYMGLIVSDKSGEQIDSELYEFHLRNSIWKESSKIFYENKEIQELFVHDFVKSSLIERAGDLNYIQFTMEFVTALLCGNLKISILLINKNKIVLLNEVISIYLKYTNSEEKREIIKIYFLEQLSCALRLIFKKIIEDIIPTNEFFSKTLDMIEYTQDISSLYSALLKFEDNVDKEDIDRLKFWVELCRLNKKDLVELISSKTMNTTFDYLFIDQKNVNSILKQVYRNFEENYELTCNFINFFLSKVPNYNIELFEEIVKYVNSPKTWKYSGNLMNKIIKISELKQAIKFFEENNSDFHDIFKNKNDNDNLEKVISVCEKFNYNTTFNKLLMEKIKNFDFKVTGIKYGEICSKYINYIENYAYAGLKIELIIAVSRIQFYLKKFTEMINPDIPNQLNLDILNSMNQALKNSRLLVYELYCLKVLRGFIGHNTLKLGSYCSRINYFFNWKIDYKKISEQVNLFMFPIPEDIERSSSFKTIQIKVAQLTENLDELDDEINLPLGRVKMLELGLAFFKMVYFMHSTKNFNNRPYIIWFESKEMKILKSCGRVFTNLIGLFIKNFPNDSICYLEERMPEQNLNIAMLINYVALICISHSRNINSFSSQFFNNNGECFDNIFNESMNMYYIGAEPIKKYDYLNSFRENFKDLINKRNKNANYKCSISCDFIYTIDRCGKPVEEMKCPFCGNKIGGTQHNLLVREGHNLLNENEAIKFLDERCKHYQTNEPKSFNHHELNVPKSIQRNLKHFNTFNLLNFFTNSVFYFIYVSESYQKCQISLIYGIKEEDLQKTIQNILKENFNVLEFLLKGKDINSILFSAANKLRETMLDPNGELIHKENRNKFEKNFESKIMAQSFDQLSIAYKKCSDYQDQHTELISFIKYIEEIEMPHEPEYKFTELFRYSTMPTWNLMKQEFELTQDKKGFGILNSFIYNYEKLQNLKLLLPIAKFSMDMVDFCSNKYTREQAENIKIGDFLSNNPNLLNPYKEFCEAWKNLNLQLNIDCDIFEKHEIKTEDSITNILADLKNNSNGLIIFAALKTLCNMQNEFFNLLSEGKKKDRKKQLLKNLSESDIFYIKPKKLDSIVRKYSTNSCEYGEGRIIYYNFKEISNCIKSYLLKLKLIETDFQKIQYIEELQDSGSNYEGAINSIMNKCKQMQLENNDKLEIERKVKIEIENSKVNENEVWHNVYEWVGKEIRYLSHQDINNDNLIKICQRKDPDVSFDASRIFEQFQCNKIVGIYQFVQIKAFDKLRKSFSKDYKTEFNSNIRSKLARFLWACYNEVSNLEYKELFFELQNVLKRIMMENLSANTNKTISILGYFDCLKYWDIKYIRSPEIIELVKKSVEEKLSSNILDEFKECYIFLTFEYSDDLNKLFDNTYKQIKFNEKKKEKKTLKIV